VIFTSVIKEVLRQRQVDVSTDWALLRKISHKRLEETTSGAIPRNNCQLPGSASKPFMFLLASGTRQLQPGPDIWEAIAALYNVERTSCTHRDQSAAPKP